MVTTLLRRNVEAVVLAALTAGVLIIAVIGHGVPLGVLALGTVGGAGLILHSIGLVLVYRANRVINFAQLQIGAVAALLFTGLVREHTFLRLLRRACPACLHTPHTVGDVLSNPRISAFVREAIGKKTNLRAPIPEDLSRARLAAELAPGWLHQIEYWLSLAFALTLGALLVWAVYAVIIRRFTQAPRLVLTIALIAAGGFVAQVGGWVVGTFLRPQPGDALATADFVPRIPLSLHLTVGRAHLSAADLILVLAAPLAAGAFAVFLRRNVVGIALRGAAENPRRAETLGVNVGSLTATGWVVAGVLGGVASILAVAAGGAAAGGSALVPALAASAVGGLVSFPLAAAGGLAIGLMDQTVIWATGSGTVVTGMLVLIIVAMFLSQRARASRADDDALGTWVASREVRPIPAELRAHPTVVRGTRGLAAGLALVLLAYPWIMSPSQTTRATETMVMGMIALSLLVLTGWAGQISLGQIAFAAIGAWTTGMSHLPLPLALILSASAGAVVAFLVGLPALRLRGLHLAISTLAFAPAVSAIVISRRAFGAHLPSSVTRPVLLGLNLDDERAFYYFVMVVLAAVVFAVMGLRRSRTARALIACKDNERAAQAFGINLVRARLSAFAIAGALAAAAGSLLTYTQHGVEAGSYDASVGVQIFLIAVLGGLGSVAGPLLGVGYLLVLMTLAATPLGQMTNLLLSPGLGVVVLLLAMPGGLAQAVFELRDAWLRRIALRHRIEVPSLLADRAAAGRVPLARKDTQGGGQAFVPLRYRLGEQWAADPLPAGETR